MTEAVERIAELLERPAKTAAITGIPTTITLSADSAKATAEMLKALDKKPGLTAEDHRMVIRAFLETSGIGIIVWMWFLLRVINAMKWARGKL